MCAPKTPPLTPGAFKLYLNFDGVTLTKGEDNSAMNTSSIVVNDPTTIPPFQPAADPTSRQGHIDQIVGHVQAAVSPYAIDVVTTRPASGVYQMYMIGGTSEQIGLGTGLLSLVAATCHIDYNGIGLEFDNPQESAVQIANAVLSDFTMMAGMGLTTTINDCANRSAFDENIVCSFGAAAMTDTSFSCGHAPTQDEPKLLTGAFGCRN
jgi:hypothetical protein